MSVSFLYIDQ